jgi:hypothetical protein
VQQQHADYALELDGGRGKGGQRQSKNSDLPAMLSGVLEPRKAQRTRLALYAFEFVEFANEVEYGLQ